jgi:hypothetical protein
VTDLSKWRFGPNVKKLIISRSSQITIDRAKATDPDAKYVFGAVVNRIVEAGGTNMLTDLREAAEWVKAAIQSVIAGEILKRAAERTAGGGR